MKVHAIVSVNVVQQNPFPVVLCSSRGCSLTSEGGLMEDFINRMRFSSLGQTIIRHYLNNWCYQKLKIITYFSILTVLVLTQISCVGVYKCYSSCTVLW